VDDGHRTLEARDMELTQGVFLVSLISNGFTRIRLTGGLPLQKHRIQEERVWGSSSDTDAAQRKSCGEERFGS
jgi:hypothetical protein